MIDSAFLIYRHVVAWIGVVLVLILALSAFSSFLERLRGLFRGETPPSVDEGVRRLYSDPTVPDAELGATRDFKQRTGR